MALSAFTTLNKWKIIATSISILMFSLIIGNPNQAKAEYETSPNPDGNAVLTLQVDKNISTAKIIVDPQGQAINAVAAYIEFSPKTLKAVKVDLSKSFCSFVIASNIDNEKGIIDILCGTPTPGINQIREVGTIQFAKKNPGKAEVRITPTSMVLANDGLGTDLLAKRDKQTWEIK
jgi:hypothetical protein